MLLASLQCRECNICWMCTQIGEPMQEAGLTKAEVIALMECIGDASVITAVRRRASDSGSSVWGDSFMPSSVHTVDWVRFVACCRLCLIQLYGYIYWTRSSSVKYRVSVEATIKILTEMVWYVIKRNKLYHNNIIYLFVSNKRENSLKHFSEYFIFI